MEFHSEKMPGVLNTELNIGIELDWAPIAGEDDRKPAVEQIVDWERTDTSDTSSYTHLEPDLAIAYVQ